MATTTIAIGTMKAAQISKAGEGFEIVEREIPDPVLGQVRTDVQACGICHSDVLTTARQWPYPGWQASIRPKQQRLLVIWRKCELWFDPGEPERYRKDVATAEIQVLEAGHFAVDTAANGSAALVRAFAGTASLARRGDAQ
jgi:hypothetical protein